MKTRGLLTEVAATAIACTLTAPSLAHPAVRT